MGSVREASFESIMFDIAFTDAEPEIEKELGLIQWGRTTLGLFSERFAAPLGVWSTADYERHWQESVQRLLNGEESTRLFISTFQFWWNLWREEENVYVQQQLLMDDDLAEHFSRGDFYSSIAPRTTVTDEGEKISEWRVGLDDLRRFSERAEANATGRSHGE